MSLYENLKHAKTEEDVKDIYIKSIGLKGVSKNLIDIQTKEVWFEAKASSKFSYFDMFTQLLHYVQVALNKDDYIPPFLAVIDPEKAALMKSSDVIPFLKKKTIQWGKSASNYSLDALAAISAHIGTYFVAYKIETHGDEFIEAIQNCIRHGEIIRHRITPDNLKLVFDKWMGLIGSELSGTPSLEPADYATFFFADVMSDGKVSTHDNLSVKLLHEGDSPVFLFKNQIYKLNSVIGYRNFWSIYDRPPKEEYRNYLLERRDSLLPLDERQFKGAYYTPLHVVEQSYAYLDDALGKNWQKDYFIWDMCCGVGNLEVKHSNHRKIFMSTLDRSDIDTMVATKTCVASHRFQYDYLNEDITSDGKIDYSLSNKVPLELRQVIRDKKKILVLINPPYAEATNAHNIGVGNVIGNKSNVAKTRVADTMMQGYGKASNELFTQFLVRIQKEIPHAVIALFSKLKYFNSTNFQDFRQIWKADFQTGFIVHSKAFDGLKGDFPIGFLIWKQGDNPLPQSITLDVRDKNVKWIGNKSFYNMDSSRFLNAWMKRPKINQNVVIPLKNAVSPYTGKTRVKNWSDDAIGYCVAKGNEFLNAGQGTFLLSSCYGGGNGFYVSRDNLLQSASVFVARKLMSPVWMNDRDQFMQPNKPLSDEFKSDCLIYMLFNGSNLTASANDIVWDKRSWSIVNHFIPFSEQDVGANERFESDFMVRFLETIHLSDASLAVMDSGRVMWRDYFSLSDSASVKNTLKLNRPDVGWYQVRKALDKRIEDGHASYPSIGQFRESYKRLSDKMKPFIYEYGFLLP